MNLLEATRILAEADIMQLIRVGAPDDEYMPEAEMVLQVLDYDPTKFTEEHVAEEIARVFNRTFYRGSPDAGSAGPTLYMADPAILRAAHLLVRSV